MELRRFATISILLMWCVTLIAFRVHRTGTGNYVFLIWNLFLAGIPYLLSTMFLRLSRAGRSPLPQVFCFLFWLLFLPNAPYILTDLLHLQSPTTAPAWYDVAILVSCAGTGLLLGHLSLIDMHQAIAAKFGAAFGWLIALVTLALTGFAIFLGRFLRWNSWDVFVEPGKFLQIAGAMNHPWNHPRALGVTFIFGFSLMLGYVAIRLLLSGPASPHFGERN
jgi:uncharacterized membrane protein